MVSACFNFGQSDAKQRVRIPHDGTILEKLCTELIVAHAKKLPLRTVVAADALTIDHEIGATMRAHVANGLFAHPIFSELSLDPFYELGLALLVARLTAALLFPVFFAS
jgi:hypothetical protein